MKYETEMQIFTHYYTGKYSDSTLAQFRCAIMQFLTYVEQPMPRITEEHIGNWMIYLVKKIIRKRPFS